MPLVLAQDTDFSNICEFCLTPVGSHIRMAFIKYLRTIVSKQVALPVRSCGFQLNCPRVRVDVGVNGGLFYVLWGR